MCGDLYSRFLLFRTRIGRECKAVVCSWYCSLAILVEGEFELLGEVV